ncbi:hypothetical protein C8R45DRAFT_827541, partial [Mycena sanguinolenta]
LLRHDSTGDDGLSGAVLCPRCEMVGPEFCCRDCFGDVMYCQACIVEKHAENPLHRVEKWHSGQLVRMLLAFLGLHMQLGHRPHEHCSAPEWARAGFVTLHTNGMHEVVVDFYGCERSQEAGTPEIQLLRTGWFLATHERPQTCATVAVLERFHQDTLQSSIRSFSC